MSPLDPALFPLHVICVFVFGSLFGSFFNVVIWRLPRRFSIVLPPSHCPSCGSPIRWYDNIPILSLVALDRRCRHCGLPISLRYAAIELLTALVFVAVFWRFGWMGATPLYLVFASLLIIGSFTDIDHWIIPDSVTFGGLAVALVASLASPWLGPEYLPGNSWPHWGGGWWQGVANAALGAAVGWTVLTLIALLGRLMAGREAMGGGDIVLLAMFGAFLGWQGALAALLIACFLGAFFGGTLHLSAKMRERLRGGPLPPPPENLPEGIDASSPEGFQRAVEHLDLHRKERRLSSHLPFGPYLCAAAMVTLLLWPQVEAMLLFFFGGPWLYR